MISFFVPGVPQSKGSMRAFWHKHLGRAMVKNDSKRTAPWERAVALQAKLAGAAMHDGAVLVDLSFRLPRPKGHLGKNGLRRSAPTAHTVKPDIDKLARACLDALTGACWHDDAQVSALTIEKLYADDVEGVGLYVIVRSRESAGPSISLTGPSEESA